MVTERSMRTTETRLIKTWHHSPTRCICPQGSTQMSKVVTLPCGRNELTRQQLPALYCPSSCVFVFSRHQQRRKCTRCLREKNWKSKVWRARLLWAGAMSFSAWWTCFRPLLLWLSGLIWIWINLEGEDRATQLKLGHKCQKGKYENQTPWSHPKIDWHTVTVCWRRVVITIIMRWLLRNTTQSCSSPWTQVETHNTLFIKYPILETQVS